MIANVLSLRLGVGVGYSLSYRGSKIAELLRATDLIIWDEAAMIHKSQAEAVDIMLRDIRRSDKEFGGVTVVFGGDLDKLSQ
jgi:hypothetical protein